MTHRFLVVKVVSSEHEKKVKRLKWKLKEVFVLITLLGKADFLLHTAVPMKS